MSMLDQRRNDRAADAPATSEVKAAPPPVVDAAALRLAELDELWRCPPGND